MFTHKYQDIISMENLLVVWKRFLRGKRHKKDVVEFEANLADNLVTLLKVLKNKTYIHGGYSTFNISDPKPRNIHKANVRDRIVHHLLYKELYPYFEQRFIYDSYSCREKRGTHKAMNRFKYFAGKVSKNQTKTCWVLKCDIKKFFANINHEVLKKILTRQIEDENISWLLSQVIDSFSSLLTSSAIAENVTKGLPLGNLTSQLLVNIYMHEFDMYIKQELRVKYYIRYADDFVILSENKTELEDNIRYIVCYLKNRLKLELHPDKVFIKTFASGVDFLGWVNFPFYRQLRKSTKKKIIKNMKGYPKLETINSYRGILKHGNTHKIRKQIRLNAD